MKGNLYLIPTLLGESTPSDVLPGSVFSLINRLGYYIAEDVRTARRFLKKSGASMPIDDIIFFELNKRTTRTDIEGFLSPALSGNDMGLVSEAGAPCIADPGSVIVDMAHKAGIRVIPLPGPSSIILAIMASGFNGQNFSFHGYLPVKPGDRIRALKKIEQESGSDRQAKVFMETPYRNMQMLDSIIQTCSSSTRLCIAAGITTGSEFIRTMTVSDWAKNKPDLHKRPAIFILQAF